MIYTFYMISKNILVKLVIFSVLDRKLKIFFLNSQLPKSILLDHESVDMSAVRIFTDSTNLSNEDNYLEQLYTINGDSEGDNTIMVVYFILYPDFKIKSSLKPAFIDAGKADKKYADYSIISYAVQRLRWKVEYTNVVYSLLSAEFTLSELQKTYEAILGRVLDKRNFRKKILSLGLLKLSGKTRTGMKARPAQMYEFKSRKPVMVKVFS